MYIIRCVLILFLLCSSCYLLYLTFDIFYLLVLFLLVKLVPHLHRGYFGSNSGFLSFNVFKQHLLFLVLQLCLRTQSVDLGQCFTEPLEFLVLRIQPCQSLDNILVQISQTVCNVTRALLKC